MQTKQANIIMKTTQFGLRLFASVLLAQLLLAKPCLSHDTPVHEAITEAAALASPELTAFLAQQIGEDNAPFLARPKLLFFPGVTPDSFSVSGSSPIEWMKKGSVMEDDEIITAAFGKYSGPARFQNHFYTPTTVPPGKLTDGFNGFDSGVDSFSWAWERDSLISVRLFGVLIGTYQNHDSWQNARDYEYTALTDPIKSVRDQNLAHMLYSLGHVVHLNQDLSQPDHTRNDNHNAGPPTRDPHVWIEPYGLRTFTSRPDWFTPPPESERGWQRWRNVGFTKLEAFWDRNLYTGAYGNTAQDARALNDDANSISGTGLGLAEFSNGNFLGEDAKYRDCWPSPIQKHYFAFPTLATSTTFPEIVAAFSPYDEEATYRDGSVGTHVYIRKIADGIAVPHHSKLTYLHSWTFYSNPRGGLRDTTINDPLVLDDYHAILLPKAVKYSGGLLDYFFRGKLEVTFTSDPSNYHVHVVNKSGQQLKGGSFQLFCDDAVGNRSLVTCPALTAAYTGGLADNASFDFDFARAQGATQFIVVYKGTIGVSGSSAIDPVDEGIAIASAIFKESCAQVYRTIVVEAIPQPVLAWLSCYQQVTAAGGTIDDVHNECGWCPYEAPDGNGGLSAQDYQAALDNAQSILASIDFDTVPASAFVPTDDACPESWVAIYYQVLSPTGQWGYEWGGFWWPEEMTYYTGAPLGNSDLVIGPAGGASFEDGGWLPCPGPVARAYKTRIVGYDHMCVSERAYTAVNSEGPDGPHAFTINNCGSVPGPVVLLDGNWAPANPAGWLPDTVRSFHGKMAWIPQFDDPVFGPVPRPVPGCLDCNCTP
jgi:hypothetical protein